jgi:hypothetical protein
MWEMAAILDFFALFRAQLRLGRSFGAEELERVLVCSPGGDGLLADLHLGRGGGWGWGWGGVPWGCDLGDALLRHRGWQGSRWVGDGVAAASAPRAQGTALYASPRALL